MCNLALSLAYVEFAKLDHCRVRILRWWFRVFGLGLVFEIFLPQVFVFAPYLKFGLLLDAPLPFGTVFIEHVARWLAFCGVELCFCLCLFSGCNRVPVHLHQMLHLTEVIGRRIRSFRYPFTVPDVEPSL